MYSIKPGRGPSRMSAIGGIAAVLFGIFWTVMAFKITDDAPFPLVHVFFPLFGVVFVIMGIIGVIYNISNATRRDRFSMLDVTTDKEEPDPLNQFAMSDKAKLAVSGSVEDRLKEIDQLLGKGSISCEEHAAQRERILREI
jgi:hypothetical protein